MKVGAKIPGMTGLSAMLADIAPGSFYHPPVKQSIEIAGHKTSISLEPLFWSLLKQCAQDRSIPVNALVARIDAARLQAERPPGLASALRIWLIVQILNPATQDG